MKKKHQWNTGYWLIAALTLLTLQSYWQAAKTTVPVPYSEFEKALAEGRVAEVLVADRTVTGKLKSPDSQGKTVIIATRVEPDLADRLSKYNVSYTRVVENTWLRDLLSLGYCRRSRSLASGSSCFDALPRSRAWAAS
jgi:cell division protease FtsH